MSDVCDKLTTRRIASLLPFSNASLLCWLVLAQTPLVAHHLWNLWSFRPHYEFSPVLLVVSLLLLRSRARECEVHKDEFTRTLALMGGCLGACLMSVSVLIVSPCLGTVACIITLGAWLVEQWGRGGTSLIGPWMLLWLIVPPPFGLDQQMIGFMQAETSVFVSGVLDCFGIEHLVSGNVFQLASGTLFIDEACSGIHSQLVLVSAALVYGVQQRKHLSRVFILATAAAFWSLCLNLLRIVFIVVSKFLWNIDLEAGVLHECVGFAFIAIGLMLVYSSDQIAQAFVHWMQRFGLDESAEYDPMRVPPTMPPASEPLSNRLKSAVTRLVPSLSHFSSISRVRFLRPLATMLLALAMALGTVQLAVAVSGPRVWRSDVAQQMISLNWLPASISQWHQITNERIERHRGSDEGQFSEVWHYATPSLHAQVSFDFPFFGWHELTDCYRSRGWQIIKQEVHSRDGHQPYMVVDMIGPDGEHGLLAFCLFDMAGNSLVSPTKSWLSRFRLAPLGGYFSGDVGMVDRRTIQLQTLVIDESELDAANRDSAQSLFEAIQLRWVTRSSTTSAELASISRKTS